MLRITLRAALAAIMLATLASAGAQSLIFSGSELPAIEVKPEASTGLNAVYVLHSVAGVTLRAEGAAEDARWLIWGRSGAADATPAATGPELGAVQPDCGYTLESGGSTLSFWVTDYSAAPYAVTGLEVSPESDCSSTTLLVEGSAPRITFTALNGRPVELPRDIELTYYTLEPAEGELRFEQTEQKRSLASVGSQIQAEAPLCATRFTLSGDRFLRQWGQPTTVSSGPCSPTAVSAVTSAETDASAAPSDTTATSGPGAGADLGGSAPVTVKFRAAVTDAVTFTQWQIASDPEMEQVMLTERSTELTYTFDTSGSYYVCFTAAGPTGACEWQSQVYAVTIGESRLRCPNAFSPGASEGVNDVWRVSHRSLVEFDCTIVNRWGVKIHHFTDPDQGWDGTYRGRPVPPGVYFYVIRARGADGKDYRLGGDINILRSR